jgi:hypothetical protein
MKNIPQNCAALLARGFAIFPLQHKSKKPLSAHGFKDATRNAEQIAAWSIEFPDCNWGVACGESSACIVIDFDRMAALEKTEREHGKFPATYTIKTARGLHLYFRDTRPRISTRRFDGGEIRADGAYVVAEGSIHPTGVQYKCVCDVEMAEFPVSLLTNFRSDPGIKVDSNASITEGHRNDSLFHLAIIATRSGASYRAVSALIQAENLRCSPPLSESELKDIADSAAKYVSSKNVPNKNIKTVASAEPAPTHAQQVAAAETPRMLEFLGLNGAPEWNSEPIDLGTLLGDTFAFIQRFVSLSSSQTLVIALWIVHSHVFAAADATPYLAITSAEKQSGKTRLLEVCQRLVAKQWMTGRVSAAVLTRKIDTVQPTLLLDESDAAFSGEKEYAEALRGVLNTGHRRGGKASCCVGQGAAIGFKDFSTFCPKAIAGIGTLPDTVADRSIPIRLKRAASDEKIERFRPRDVKAETESLRGLMETWAPGAIEILRNSRPALPDQLSDRQQDGAEPLLAIADLAGGEWPKASRHALIELCVEARATDDSKGVRLLADIRTIFNGRGIDRIASVELATALAEIETSPWGEWSHGKPLSPAKLARLLGKYTITPATIRIDERTPRGYELKDFHDAFRRYLPSEVAPISPPPDAQSATTPQGNADAGPSGFSKCNANPVLRFKKLEIANKKGPCGGVAVSNAPIEEEL